MSDMFEPTSDTIGGWRAGFRGGIGTLLAVAIIVAVLVTGVNAAQVHLFGRDIPALLEHLSQVPGFALVILIALLAFRREEIGLRSIGLDRSLVLPAVVTVAGLVAAANLVAMAQALRTGDGLQVGFIYDHSPTLVAVATVNTYVFNAVAEELLTRGYFQNKLVVLLDGRGDRFRRAAGVAGASGLFALLHVPTLLQQGVPVGAIPFGLLPLFVTGIAFGTVYELTRNLYLVVLLHGVGNYWPLFVEGVQWPNWPALLVLYALLVLAYRAWAGVTTRRTLGVAG
ncbi:MAG: lysostaphin resistance A-like protein [Haloglomus sp.]